MPRDEMERKPAVFLASVICLLVGLAGCRTHLTLRDRTVQTVATLADLHYQHVLENVARFTNQPSTLPSIAVVNNGNVLVSDQGSLGGSGTYAPTIVAADQIGGFPIFNLFMNPNVTRNLTENWSMVPVTDINKIRRLRCAFQVLVGAPCLDNDECLKTLDGFIPGPSGAIDRMIPRGWYCVGTRKQVPKNACYVGHHNETYVWVMRDGVEGLSQFTMTVMQLATSEIDESDTKTVVQTYDPEGRLLSTEITTEVPDDDGDDSNNLIESGAHMDSNAQPIRRKMLQAGGHTPKHAARSPKQARKRGGP